MSVHHIRIATIPVGQPRPRVSTIGGHAMAYTRSDHPVHQFKSDLRAGVLGVMDEPILGPIAVEVLMVFPRPQSLIWSRKPMPRAWHTKKPDADNCAKAVLDALNGIAWRDDSQVTELVVRKCVASGSELPGVELRIEEITDGPIEHRSGMRADGGRDADDAGEVS